MGKQIAIDGPAGAGKSTIARLIAARKGFIYVDTGAMYRALALYLLRQGIDGGDEAAVAAHCGGADITIAHEDGEQVVYLNGENVNHLLRTEEVGQMASVSSAHAAVRAHLLGLQKQLAEEHDVVMDGRDIGTAILPQAEVKIYLTATAKDRAMRRYLEYEEKGVAADLEELEQDIIRRDHQDMTRAHSPLRQAEDAVYVDTTGLSLEEGIEKVWGVCCV